MEITEKTKVIDIIHHSAGVVMVFKNHRLDCVGCKGVAEETVEQVAVNNGMDPAEFLEELKAAMKEQG